jgi:hypothetical protein
MAFSFNYDVVKSAPTVAKFLRATHQNTFIMGPIGSGKSVGCCVKIFLIAMNQAPAKDGVRHTRFTIVRNTRDQLNDTTLKTWQKWFPDGNLGRYKISDRTYIFDFIPADKIPVKAEVMFRALDDAADVAKVLSMEVTAAWLNECREIPREIVENLGKRCGRYPDDEMRPDDIPKDKWPTFYGLFGDTNAPEQDSYWESVFEHLPVDEDDEESILECETFKQPSGDSPEAENVEHLPGGQVKYYAREGRSEEWFRTMVQVQYARSIKGKPVYDKSFKPDRHISKVPLKVHAHLPVIIGLDTARKPAAVFQQMTLDGRILTQHETYAFDTGAEIFIARYLRPIINNFYPNHALVFVIDPAGNRQNETDDNTWFKALKKAFKGHTVKPAITNDPVTRITATDDVFRTWPEGEPMNIIDPCCKYLIQGLRGKYRYVRIKGTDNKFSDKPDKNAWSHTVEAKQYADLFLTSKYYRPEDYLRATYNPLTQQTRYKPADSYTGY